jgi:hypothetical protein
MLTIKVIYPLYIITILQSSCVSTQAYHWQQTELREGLSHLRKGCQLTARSGFSAEVSIPLYGTTRIDAAWDASNHLNGQVVNTLGEDLINFKIDGSGILQTDVSVQKDLVLGTALDFLAELGTAKARLLLCSGLFLASVEDFSPSFGQETSSVEFDVKTHSSEWHIVSSVRPVFPLKPRPQDLISISSDVRTSSTFFSRSVAKINWTGAKKEGIFRPQELSIQAGKQSIKLSFLDFE